MNIFSQYIEKYQINSGPDFGEGVGLIVIVPVYDEPDIFPALHSLFRCPVPVGEKVGIIIVVNHSEKAPERAKRRNRETVLMLEHASLQLKRKTDVQLFIIQAFDIPEKEAGVGYARKRGMDAAVFYYAHDHNEKGIMASLDADTLVEKNYFTCLLETFKQHRFSGVAVNFEHLFEDEEQEVKSSIIKYELYLRYYRHALLFLNHPYAFYSIGSAFAVRVKDYVAVGGMNRRQAGEDFYFIQKLIAGGKFATLFGTKVYPSGRISERTPFGTGQAVKSIIENRGEWNVYHFSAFKLLRPFLENIDTLFKAGKSSIEAYVELCQEPVKDFLMEIDFLNSLVEINRNTSSEKQFLKRFFDYFNAFKILKYLNSLHPVYYQKQPVLEAVRSLNLETGRMLPADDYDALSMFRQLDNNNTMI